MQRRKPIDEIGGGGRMRRCTQHAADALDFLSREIWEGHREQMQEIGFLQPASSVAIDFLLFVCQREGICTGIDKMTPQNNLYLAIAD